MNGLHETAECWAVADWGPFRQSDQGTLPMNFPAPPMPRPTAQVEAYVEALGPELAVTFLLHFGGAEMSVPDSPNGRSAHEALIGADAAARLSAVSHRLQKRVPLAKAWLAAMLAWQGHSVAHIARTLRVSDVSVRNMLRKWAG